MYRGAGRQPRRVKEFTEGVFLTLLWRITEGHRMRENIEK